MSTTFRWQSIVSADICLSVSFFLFSFISRSPYLLYTSFHPSFIHSYIYHLIPPPFFFSIMHPSFLQPMLPFPSTSSFLSMSFHNPPFIISLLLSLSIIQRSFKPSFLRSFSVRIAWGWGVEPPTSSCRPSYLWSKFDPGGSSFNRHLSFAEVGMLFPSHFLLM